MGEQFHVVAGTAEFESTSQLHVEIDGIEILLCRFEDEYFALSYYCSHEQLTLHGGELADGRITCPYHGAEFSLASGEVLAPPAFEAVTTYPVRWDEKTISVGLPQ